MCVRANLRLPADVLRALKSARKTEKSKTGLTVLDAIIQNSVLAGRESIPLCQDTGFAVVFLEIGQDIRITGGDLYNAVNNGIRKGYLKGYLRKSVVGKPFSNRKNTGDNTPAVIHANIVPGNRLKITLLPKGGGAENMSRLKMLTPAMGRKGIEDFVVETVKRAGSNPCPPVIVGVGIGGTSDKAMLLAKKALLRKTGKPSGDRETAKLEKALLSKINALGTGPAGFGGTTTALAVHVETFPCHIASLPVAVNLQCHSARRVEATL